MTALIPEFRGYSLSSGKMSMTLRRRPEIGPRGVRVAIRAASLNYRDLLIRQGQGGTAKPDLVPLSDGAGDVIEVGSEVAGLAPGDRVMPGFFQTWLDGPFDPAYFAGAAGGAVDGVLAEEIVVPASALVRIPDSLTYAEAATLPCAAVTAWGALFERGRPLKAGDVLLVQGTGGVAMFGLQFAKAVGAKVVVLSSSDEKLSRAEALGAEIGINYREHPNWAAAVRSATGGHGADHILELGGAQTFGQSLEAVAANGSIAQIGVLTGYGAAPNLNGLFSANATINGIMVGPRAFLEKVADFVARHRIAPVIDRTFAFDQAEEAYRYLEAANHLGKVVITR
jgi:NADPH:quinone reductase-like Zn-dependent oxidoreductase